MPGPRREVREPQQRIAMRASSDSSAFLRATQERLAPVSRRGAGRCASHSKPQQHPNRQVPVPLSEPPTNDPAAPADGPGLVWPDWTAATAVRRAPTTANHRIAPIVRFPCLPSLHRRTVWPCRPAAWSWSRRAAAWRRRPGFSRRRRRLWAARGVSRHGQGSSPKARQQQQTTAIEE